MCITYSFQLYLATHILIVCPSSSSAHFRPPMSHSPVSPSSQTIDSLAHRFPSSGTGLPPDPAYRRRHGHFINSHASWEQGHDALSDDLQRPDQQGETSFENMRRSPPLQNRESLFLVGSAAWNFHTGPDLLTTHSQHGNESSEPSPLNSPSAHGRTNSIQ